MDIKRTLAPTNEQLEEINWLEIAKHIYTNIYKPIFDSCDNSNVRKTINLLIRGMKQLTEEETTTTEFMYLRYLYLTDKEQLFEVMQECLYKEAKAPLHKAKHLDLKSPSKEQLDKQLEELKELERLEVIDKSVIDRFIEITK